MANTGVTWFRQSLLEETSRLTELCRKWKCISAKVNLSDDVDGLIRCAIGQAQLLLDKRFKQFAALVDDCEFRGGSQLVTCDDLQGYWDMMYFQVEDLISRFELLDKLQTNDWKIPQ